MAMKKKTINNLFNFKQRQAIEYSNRVKPDIMFLDGAVGSGKTTAAAMLFLQHVWLNRSQGYDYILTGHSVGSVERNVLKTMRDKLGIETTLDKFNSFEFAGNRIHCFGTEKADSHEAMRGMNAAGHYGNELTLSHMNSLQEVMDRVRVPGARFFWEMNPGSESHYLYRTWIEPNPENSKKFARFNFSLYDNSQANGGFLPQEYIERLEASKTGIWHRRDILGEWCSIEGQLYFPESLQYYDDQTMPADWLKGATIHAYMDPATGSDKKAGCFTSIFIGALIGTKIYILDCLVRKLNPEEAMDSAGQIARKYNYSLFAIEDNFSQAGYVVEPMKRKYPFLPIQGQSSRQNKLDRLIGMYPVVMEKVVFPQRFLHNRNSEGWLFLQQLANITSNRDEKSGSDLEMLDAPDALEGLIRTFRNFTNENYGNRLKAAAVKINDRW